MKFVPKAVSLKVGRAALQTQKHSPTLLFGAGIVGMVATVVLASKSTLKLEEVLEKTNDNLATAKELFDSGHQNYSASDYRQDQVVTYLRGAGSVAKLYTPALVVGTLSVACLTGSHHILTQRNLAVTAAYAALERGYNEYRQRVVDEYGADKDRELRHGLERVEVTKDGVTTSTMGLVSGAPSQYARFFDEYSKNWEKTAEYNLLFLRCQQQYATDLLRSRGHVFLNEVYDSLGIDRTKAGAVVGWILGEGDDFVDFGLYDDRESARSFVNGRDGAILLDFNVAGLIYDKI